MSRAAPPVPAAGKRLRIVAPQATPPTERPHAATIALVQASSLPMLVQRELERMILAGDLAAGEQLREVDLAERLGVSRGPVREAFRALEASGLVKLEKNRGVYVRQISLREADEIYELRAMLDAHVGRRLATSVTASQLRELRQKVAELDAAASAGNVDAYLAANVDFHDHLVELAGNAKLLQVYRRLVNELRLYRHKSLAQGGGTLTVSTREHRDIVRAIGEGQPEAAARALFDHAMASRARMHKAAAAADEAAARPPSRRRASRA